MRVGNIWASLPSAYEFSSSIIKPDFHIANKFLQTVKIKNYYDKLAENENKNKKGIVAQS